MYSIDFRRRVLNLKIKYGLTLKEAGERFGVSVRSLMRWRKKIEPCSSRPKAPSKIQDEALLDDIKKYPNAYLKERAQRLGVSTSGIHNAMKRIYTRSKKRPMR